MDIPRFIDHPSDPSTPEYWKYRATDGAAGVVMREDDMLALTSEAIKHAPNPGYALLVDNLAHSLSAIARRTHQPVCVSADLAKVLAAQAFPDYSFDAPDASISHLPLQAKPSSPHDLYEPPGPGEVLIQGFFAEGA